MDFLATELDAIGDVTDGVKVYWTGGTDKGREGQWFWITSLKEMGDFILFGGQPNGGLGSNCVGLWPGFDYHGGDDPCTSKFYPICQIHV